MRVLPKRTCRAAGIWALTVVGLQGVAMANGTVPVEVAEVDGRYRLVRGGEVYEVRGAGLEFGDTAALAAHNGNSFRTWRTDNGRLTGRQVLDNAQALGLTVALCIEIGRERHGFDYDDAAAVAAQLERARAEVLEYKDHPALLAWVIGNEVNLSAGNPRYMDAIDGISRMIHAVDGQHPTTTALAGFGPGLAALVRERAPDLDFISVQFYGDIVNLPRYLEQTGWDRPYMVTEWGAIGHWEVGRTPWGAPIEQNSTDKAASYLRAWETALATDARYLLGNYVFLWGQKQERTPTWYGMFLADGAETEVIDVMHYVWNGQWPGNRAPRVGPLRIGGLEAPAGITLPADSVHAASIAAADPDSDPLTFRWEVMRESEATQEGGDHEEIPEALAGLVSPGAPGAAQLTAPAEPGAYRLFVYVYDGQGHAAHANVPFRVEVAVP